MSFERYCPECGEVVPAGIVRHRPCFLLAAERESGRTEREWLERTWGDRVDEIYARKGVMQMPVYDID